MNEEPRGLEHSVIAGSDASPLDLELAYQHMARDEAREREALAWAEATLLDGHRDCAGSN
jgi:hypothetical protein